MEAPLAYSCFVEAPTTELDMGPLLNYHKAKITTYMQMVMV
jgi:hypothetical protein